jgi:hypothetical protein
MKTDYSLEEKPDAGIVGEDDVVTGLVQGNAEPSDLD